jgi:hypothetical protein
MRRFSSILLLISLVRKGPGITGGRLGSIGMRIGICTSGGIPIGNCFWGKSHDGRSLMWCNFLFPGLVPVNTQMPVDY